MLKHILHVGITVSDLNRSKEFYHTLLGLKNIGELTMEGQETELLFGKKGTKAIIVQ